MVIGYDNVICWKIFFFLFFSTEVLSRQILSWLDKKMLNTKSFDTKWHVLRWGVKLEIQI